MDNKLPNIKYNKYPTNSVGMIIIDKNTDTSPCRKFIEIQHEKLYWSEYKNVIDTSITELPVNINVLHNPLIVDLTGTKADQTTNNTSTQQSTQTASII